MTSNISEKKALSTLSTAPRRILPGRPRSPGVQQWPGVHRGRLRGIVFASRSKPWQPWPWHSHHGTSKSRSKMSRAERSRSMAFALPKLDPKLGPQLEVVKFSEMMQKMILNDAENALMIQLYPSIINCHSVNAYHMGVIRSMSSHHPAFTSGRLHSPSQHGRF